MAYNPVGVDETNKLPVAVVTPAADTVLKASSATAIRAAIDAAQTSHTHTSIAITDLTEYIQDTVAGLLKAGTGVTTSYDDAANTFTINATASGGTGTTDPEVVRDTIGGALSAGSGISVTVNDAADTITIAVAGVPQSAISGLAATLALLAPLASPTFTGTVATPALKVTGGTIAAGKVLTSDSTGNATWQDTAVALQTMTTTIDLANKRYPTSSTGYGKFKTGDQATTLVSTFPVIFPSSGKVRIKVATFFEVKNGTFALAAYNAALGTQSTVGQVAYAGATALTFGTSVTMEATGPAGSTQSYELQSAMTYLADPAGYGSILGDSSQKLFIEVVPVP